MEEVDYNSLVEKVPELYKHFLNEVEKCILHKDVSSARQCFENYKSFKSVMKRQGIVYSQFRDRENKLEKMIEGLPESNDEFNNRVMEEYKRSQFSRN